MSNLDNSGFFDGLRQHTTQAHREFMARYQQESVYRPLTLRDVGISLSRNKMAWTEQWLRAEAQKTSDFALQYLIAMTELGIKHLADELHESLQDLRYVINFAPAIRPTRDTATNTLVFSLTIRQPGLGKGLLVFTALGRPYWTIAIEPHPRISYDVLGFIDGMGQRCTAASLRQKTDTPHLRQIELD